MGDENQILIVGAGASGLMAARELSKTGKKVIILEARDRIGGRIYPLDKNLYGYPAQGGAEFVHGPAKITRELTQEAGLTYTSITDGVFWRNKNGVLTSEVRGEMFEDTPLRKKLQSLKKDMSIAEFFNRYFPEEQYQSLKKSVFQMVERYDAGDPQKMSTFSVRDDWLGGSHKWIQGKIVEGYGAMLDYLANECKKNGVEINLGCKVKAVNYGGDLVTLDCENGNSYKAKKTIITIPIQLINSIDFSPSIPEVMNAAMDIGYGGGIKVIIKFREVWWENINGKDLSKMNFLVDNTTGQTWWTTYPDRHPILTCFIAGPEAEKCRAVSSESILSFVLSSLERIFDISKDSLDKQYGTSDVVNWTDDSLTQGAYSYPTPETSSAENILNQPVDNKIFFAGEALAGEYMASVEGALFSGKNIAYQILQK